MADRLTYIVDKINTSLKNFYFKDTVYHNICEQAYKGEQRLPVYYKGNGQYDYVGFSDKSGLNIYHRIKSFSETDNNNEGFGNGTLREEKYSILMVVFGSQSKVEGSHTFNINYRIADEIKGKIPQMLSKSEIDYINCTSCLIRPVSVNTDKYDVFNDEFDGVDKNKIKPNSILFAIEYSVDLKFMQSCKVDTCPDSVQSGGSSSSSGYVTIFDINGTVVTTVNAGGSYTIPCGLIADGTNTQLYADVP